MRQHLQCEEALRTAINAIALWMLNQLYRVQYLNYGEAAHYVAATLGTSYVSYDTQGSVTIDPAVMDAFDQLAAGCVIWEPGPRAWRLRAIYDAPGRCAA